MHLKGENIHIYVSSLLKYKMHLHLRDSIEGHLHYITLQLSLKCEFIFALLLEIALHKKNYLS
jgi:hypothetical protein